MRRSELVTKVNYYLSPAFDGTFPCLVELKVLMSAGPREDPLRFGVRTVRLRSDVVVASRRRCRDEAGLNKLNIIFTRHDRVLFSARCHKLRTLRR
jgi:hypothetical protein